MVPEERGLPPAYGQRAFDRAAAERGFELLASRDGRAGSLQLRQDLDLWLALLAPGDERELRLRPGRHAFVHVARGEATLNGQALEAGDGAAVTGEESLRLSGRQAAEVLVFDLA